MFDDSKAWIPFTWHQQLLNVHSYPEVITKALCSVYVFPKHRKRFFNVNKGERKSKKNL